MTRCRPRQPRHIRLLAGAFVAMASGAAAAADATAVVEQPRSFGHVVGDVLTQRVLLDGDRQPLPANLPAPQRLSAWIERRPARTERGTDGRRWLVVDYQLVNAPRSLATVRIPAWRLAGDAARPALLVPAWPIGVSPIIASATPGTSAWELRPDRPAPAVATGPLRLRLMLDSIALAVCLAAWVGWWAWRHWRDAMTQPFASACRVLGRHDDPGGASWRAMHEAFDRTAGEVLRASTLQRLFERAPQFAPFRGRIEDFYAQSAARFFGAAGAAAPPRALCHDLRRVERRIQR